ncbi:hypothetical protein TNIN_450381 [Trichonephila inaurata madagascariensis]|uniref:Uncharacterized protein n=1 Tax=Trichonephila inaurata madagascariensis TaxID=2747483 RepID=A0A8X6XFE5_9ARAC|nr:hypothetical protein TNIN_450381 [Trichonephila inaurata madagascariensis]
MPGLFTEAGRTVLFEANLAERNANSNDLEEKRRYGLATWSGRGNVKLFEKLKGREGCFENKEIWKMYGEKIT